MVAYIVVEAAVVGQEVAVGKVPEVVARRVVGFVVGRADAAQECSCYYYCDSY